MGENLHREKQTGREAVLAFVEYAKSHIRLCEYLERLFIASFLCT